MTTETIRMDINSKGKHKLGTLVQLKLLIIMIL